MPPERYRGSNLRVSGLVTPGGSNPWVLWPVLGPDWAWHTIVPVPCHHIRGDDSVLWFGLSAALLLVGVISFMIAGFVAVMLILTIAAIAIINGFTDITLALEHPRTKYVLIPGMIITGILLMAGLFYYFPGFEKYLFLSVVGTFALVFGFFSILLGFYKTDEPAAEE